MRLTVVCLLVLIIGVAQCQVRPEPPSGNLPAQRIGANDLLAISVYDSPELTRTVRVGADGLIRLPMLGARIKAEGLLPVDLESAIAVALRAEKLFVDPVVTVTIAEYHSRPISVAGAVKNPVTFQADGPVTLLDALTRAGGLGPDAGPDILVSRMQATGEGGLVALVQRIPVKALIDMAEPEMNLRMTGGEEIRVPEVGRVYVVGTVRKPGAFPVRNTSETTVLQMLALAEGLAPFASKLAYVYRQDAASETKHEIPIELKKILDRKSPDVPLQPNDILYIPDNSGRRITVTTLEKIAAFGASTASGILIWR
jgi:polysaccharide export outer membrane protein